MAVTFMESLHVNRHAVTAACQSLRYLPQSNLFVLMMHKLSHMTLSLTDRCLASDMTTACGVSYWGCI